MPDEGSAGSLAQAKEPHLPGANKLCHRPDGVFDRDRRINPVLIVEINEFYAKPT